MRARYSKRAAGDVRRAGLYSQARFGVAAASAFRAKLRQTIAMLERLPAVGRELADRPGVRAVALGRFPYTVFYEVVGEDIHILHVRHLARRPWEGE